MNTNNIKAYAPKARKDFIAAVTKQAAKYGITENEIHSVEIKGDIALVDGRPFPAAITKPRADLVQLIEQKGFNVVIEQVAYSWFNRLCAIRYMELHDYLGHGRRVLSHSSQGHDYQILEDCLDIDLPGLDQEKVRDLKVDGTKDEELYRELLLAQCHALHQAMPFLFEPVDDATELLLPENLTKTDSLIRELVDAIPEEDWANIEIIGWLYQFYISEKKDEVIGKVVKSEDIPAATQLFTPNWIVKYMVQNSLGAQWLATYPQSPLKGQMEYYIEPAEQTDEVNAQLKAITPSSLNPEELTLIDPACGSGHILVEAYDLFKAIYLERGYRQRDIAQLVLEKNLFGLDIDERAAQLSGFALMMKARADDRRLFDRGVKLNVMALQDSAAFDPEKIVEGMDLAQYGLKAGDLTELKRLFEHATTFGSLIQIPEELAEVLPALKQLSEVTSQDLFISEALRQLRPLVRQAEMLAAQYDVVVANPPYMGGKGMNGILKNFAKDSFPNAKSDLFACFIDRGFGLLENTGHNAMVTMESWMFLSSYENFRGAFLQRHTLQNLAHFPYDGKRPTAMGINFGVAVISAQNTHIADYQGHYCCSRHFELSDDGVPFEFPTRNERLKIVSGDEFNKIPGTPVAYWANEKIRRLFTDNPSLRDDLRPKQGSSTGDDETFVRFWNEIDIGEFGLGLASQDEAHRSGRKYFPFNKGGEYRKWYGNNEKVLRYDTVAYNELLQIGNHLPSRNLYFKEGLTWSKITSYRLSVRYDEVGSIFSSVGLKGFPDGERQWSILGYMNSSLVNLLTGILSPTLSIISGDIEKLPSLCLDEDMNSILSSNVCRVVEEVKRDWDAYERSWNFHSSPLMAGSLSDATTLESSYAAWINQNRETFAEIKRIEEENNRLFINAYCLEEELTPEVPLEQVTLTVNPAYRYGSKIIEEEQWKRFREDTMEELVSYAVGCMMGRYSLDTPGLIYAHSGNEGFDHGKYTNFPADDDGIIPLTSMEWFDDDAANRLEEFISVVWENSHLEQNLAFLADNLSPKRGEGSRDTIRRYLSDKFFKDHLQTYKKRPIYWLFSSGKEKAFQCLVYLHRYNEGTLARMRTEYVIPLTAKLSAYVDKLEKDKEASGSTAEIKKLEKQITQHHKQQAELSTFDEKLRHYADQRIKLDLDDGVKVNYDKFGDLLAEVKAVTGKKAVS